MKTLKNYLHKAEAFLREKKIEKPRLEAQILFAHRLQLKRYELYTNDHLPLKQNEVDDLRSLLVRRAQGEPTAYIIGYKEFYSYKFFVTPDVLIPRPETEELVELFLKHCSKAKPKVLDLCCGSGAIGISLLCQKNNLQVCFADVSFSAMQVCKKNFFTLCENKKLEENLEAKIKKKAMFLISDLFDNIHEQFDAIVSNPPYVTEVEFDSLPLEVKSFEPKLALKIPTEKFFEKLFLQSFAHLNKDGIFLLETNPNLIKQQENLMKEVGFSEIQIFEDLSRRPRFLLAKKC